MEKEVNMRHVRTKKQQELYKKIAEDDICSFCADFCSGHSPTYHPNPILKETEWWALTENMEPYAGAKLHFLIVYKKHVFGPPLQLEAWVELGEIVEWTIKNYDLPAGGFYFRFGETDFTGSSVQHFHANIIFGGEKDGEKLKIKLGYTKNKK